MQQRTLGTDLPVSAIGLGCPTAPADPTRHGTTTTLRTRPFPRVRS